MDTELDDGKMLLPLLLNAVMSLVGFIVTMRVLPASFDLFLKAGLSGRDMSKRTPRGKQPVQV